MLAGGAAKDFGLSIPRPCLLLNKKTNPLQIIVVLFFFLFPLKIFRLLSSSLKYTANRCWGLEKAPTKNG